MIEHAVVVDYDRTCHLSPQLCCKYEIVIAPPQWIYTCLSNWFFRPWSSHRLRITSNALATQRSSAKVLSWEEITPVFIRWLLTLLQSATDKCKYRKEISLNTGRRSCCMQWFCRVLPSAGVLRICVGTPSTFYTKPDGYLPKHAVTVVVSALFSSCGLLSHCIILVFLRLSIKIDSFWCLTSRHLSAFVMLTKNSNSTIQLLVLILESQ